MYTKNIYDVWRLIWNVVAEEAQRVNVLAGIIYLKKNINKSWKNTKKISLKKNNTDRSIQREVILFLN